MEDKLKKQVEEQISRSQKETYLQDQLRSIQKELGQADDGQTEPEEVDQKIMKQKCLRVEEEARKELKKLQMMSPLSSEANVVRNIWRARLYAFEQEDQDNFDLIRRRKSWMKITDWKKSRSARRTSSSSPARIFERADHLFNWSSGGQDILGKVNRKSIDASLSDEPWRCT